MIKAVPVEQAVGKRLAYDTTIVTRDRAGVLLERGHVITEADVDLLKSSGLYLVYVTEEGGEGVFESEIASRVARALAGDGVEVREGRQGSALLLSSRPGVLRVDARILRAVNLSGLALLITRRPYEAFGAGELLGFVDSIPISCSNEELDALVKMVRPAVSVKGFTRRRIGLVITGTEIYEGRKQDLYTEVVEGKARKYGWDIVFREVVPDSEGEIAEAIKRARGAGSEAIIVTGGMSVDPTDRTPAAIASLGARIVAHGIPIKPTTMTLVAYWRGTPILGLSSGGIYYREVNAIDVIFTLMMAGVRLSRGYLAGLGAGGLLPSFKPAAGEGPAVN